eukprot:CAMPEP_0115012632 /NCGR_PEP_ID=MMETSP0216-20121206/24867_1 /TAXON_ID=223996 /ORGANISM="Protocruzia adherens, Strain Boccale" /LENGTH=247 /DNA_ID=CAMNT_0002381755 /DNA_START=45 /DNA_END=785 /DNA_ORIENTATION=+
MADEKTGSKFSRLRRKQEKKLEEASKLRSVAQIFSGIKLCFLPLGSELSLKKIKLLSDLITKRGGVVADLEKLKGKPHIDQFLSHIVVSKDTTMPGILKLLKLKDNEVHFCDKITIVLPDWISECIKRDKQIDTFDFTWQKPFSVLNQIAGEGNKLFGKKDSFEDDPPVTFDNKQLRKGMTKTEALEEDSKPITLTRENKRPKFDPTVVVVDLEASDEEGGIIDTSVRNYTEDSPKKKELSQSQKES